jgi:hypothetical protein
VQLVGQVWRGIADLGQPIRVHDGDLLTVFGHRVGVDERYNACEVDPAARLHSR